MQLSKELKQQLISVAVETFKNRHKVRMSDTILSTVFLMIISLSVMYVYSPLFNTHHQIDITAAINIVAKIIIIMLLIIFYKLHTLR